MRLSSRESSVVATCATPIRRTCRHSRRRWSSTRRQAPRPVTLSCASQRRPWAPLTLSHCSTGYPAALPTRVGRFPQERDRPPHLVQLCVADRLVLDEEALEQPHERVTSRRGEYIAL